MIQQKKQQMKDRKKLEGLNNSDKNKPIEVLKFAIAVFLFWIYVKTKADTIGYPEFLFNTLFLVIYILLVLIMLQKTIFEFKNINNRIDRWIFIVFYILKNSIFSVCLSGVFLIPFNLFNINYSKRNNIEIIKCEITGLSDYSKNSSFYYNYQGQETIIYAHKQLMSYIYINKNHRDYLFVAQVRKGLLDTYIIESWDIVRK